MQLKTSLIPLDNNLSIIKDWTCENFGHKIQKNNTTKIKQQQYQIYEIS
jgi:hypothetical protein